eukprot:345458-Prymnesium_polylepis.1
MRDSAGLWTRRPITRLCATRAIGPTSSARRRSASTLPRPRMVAHRQPTARRAARRFGTLTTSST